MPTKEEKDAELLALMEKAQNDTIGTQPQLLPNVSVAAVAPSDVKVTSADGTPQTPVAAPAPVDAPPVVTAPVQTPPQAQDAPPAPVTPQAPPAATPVPASSSGPPTEAGSVKAIDAARGSAYGEADAQRTVGDEKAKKLSKDAESQGVETAEARKAEQEIADKQKSIEIGRAKAEAIRDNSIKRMENYRLHDHFKDMTDGERIRAKIAVGLGAFAAAGQYSNNPRNQVLDQINHTIDQEHARDELEVRKNYDIAKLRQEGAQQFEANMASDLAALKFKQGNAQRAAASELKAQLMENGVPLAEVESNANYKKLIAGADEKFSEAYTKLMAIHGNLALARFKAAKDGPADPRALADVAEFAKTHSQDETYRYAAGRGIKDLNKSVQPIIDNNNSTDSKKTKQDESDAKNSVMLEGGKPFHVVSGRGGAQAFGTRDQDFNTAIDSLEKYRDHVKEAGEHTVLNGATRDELYNNAAAAVATVSPLGKNEESIAIEKGALGPSGTFMGHNGSISSLARGADAAAAERKIEEIKKKRENYRKTMLVGYGKEAAKATASAHPVGSTVTVKGKLYRVASDGDTLEPL